MSDIFNDKDGLGGLDDLFKQLKMDKIMLAQLNDQRLTKVAEYDITKGYMFGKVTNQQLQGKFFEFKRLCLSGEKTLKDIEDEVYSKWGVTEEGRENATSEPESKPITGFSIEDIKVAKMKETDKRNH